MIHIVAITVILLSMGMILVRAMKGPTTYDRILSANVFGTATVLTIVLYAGLENEPAFIDVALLYGLINFTATIALLRYFKIGGFNDRD